MVSVASYNPAQLIGISYNSRIYEGCRRHLGRNWTRFMIRGRSHSGVLLQQQWPAQSMIEFLTSAMHFAA